MTDSCPSTLIIGAGTFGLSTAYHLALRGYNDITVVDRYPPPSRGSAMYDLNKIIRSEYNDDLLGQCAVDAIKEWRTNPVFSPFYHETGWYLLASKSVDIGKGRGEAQIHLRDSFDASIRRGGHPVWLEDSAVIRRNSPYLAHCADDLYGLYNAEAGWIESANALEALAKEVERLGVKLRHGPSATMKSLLRDKGKVVGITTEGGSEIRADRTILAAGAWNESLFDFEGQLVSGGYTVMHIQLTPDETKRYAAMPVLDHEGVSEHGVYLFAPSPDGMLKLGMTCTARTNKDSLSLSRPYDGLDAELAFDDQERAREVLRLMMPELAERPFIKTRLCFDGESSDAHWIISPHPSSPELILCAGGTGHSAKNLPLLGSYVVDAIEGKVRKEWRWRPSMPPNNAHFIDIKEQADWQERLRAGTSYGLEVSRRSQRAG